MRKVYLLGTQVAAISVTELLAKIDMLVQKKQRAIITHLHVMGANLAFENRWFREFLNSSYLTYCDGMGIQLGARILGDHLPARMTLADWIWDFAAQAEKRQYRLFFLGNPPGAAERAAERLLQRHPLLRIVGSHHGFFDLQAGSLENQALIAQINASQPDILFVGLGMPAQEKWLLENWPRLSTNLAITCGGIFEYVAQDIPRGPRWMSQHYLEWLARIVLQPRRYFVRYLRDNPLFFSRVLRQRFFGLRPPKTSA